MELTTGETITREEFEGIIALRRFSAEGRAVKALLPLTGVKFPCRWKHYKRGICGGGMAARLFGRAAGFKVRAACKNGTLYVFRYE